MVETEKSRVEKIQEVLGQMEIPGWLFYDFRGSDPLAYRILGLNPEEHTTRRWFYFVPQSGEPVKLVHRIESGRLDPLPGRTCVYLAWQTLQNELESILRGCDVLALQYSDNNSIPYVSKVDAGTVEFLRRLGKRVVSSADILQQFDCVWSETQVEGHRKVAGIITRVVREAFETAAGVIRREGLTTELAIQEFILRRFEEEGIETEFPPIVGVNANSGNPHYCPTVEASSEVHRGDFLLIDLWARMKQPDSVFADITWTGFFGTSLPERIGRIFDIVRRSRDRGVEFLHERFSRGQDVRGFEVDDEVRKVIADAGFSDYFIHRTGHNLGREIHGSGVNFDNLETHDTRRVLPGIACTIEPGIYLDEFGVRSEINLFITPDGPDVTTPPQKEVLLLPV